MMCMSKNDKTPPTPLATLGTAENQERNLLSTKLKLKNMNAKNLQVL